MNKIKVGIIGGTGYTGVELLRLLLLHPQVEITCITSRSESGQTVTDIFPSLRGFTDLVFTQPTSGAFTGCDVVFSATPNGVAMTHARELHHQGIKLIDLAADFRLHDIAIWEQWYGQQHACPELVEQAVYGLPEINRERIKKASIVANPGCYPTAITLGFLPLLQAQWIDPGNLIADAKSGVSGAGRAATLGNLYSEVSDSFKAYGVAGHRHQPEISETLAALGGAPVNLTFVPHLVPMLRGIHATLYCDLLDSATDLNQVQDLFEECYKNEPFVDVMPPESHPDTRSVKSSNICRIAAHTAGGTGKLVLLSVIDNLTKGAAGQAVQNMNIMFGFEETIGLQSAALVP